MIAEDSVRFAHSGPSQRILRGLTTTCLRRAPPATRVRGWTRLLNHYCPPSWKTLAINWLIFRQAMRKIYQNEHF